MRPDDGDLRRAYDILGRRGALRLNGSTEMLWSDRPRLVSLQRSQEVTRRILELLDEHAFLRSDGLVLPEGLRIYGIHDTVMNCICSARPGGGSDIVMFSGVLSIPLMRFAVQIMVARLDTAAPPATAERFGGWSNLVECAMAYTIWQLIEAVPISMAELGGALTEVDRERLAAAFAGIVTFLFLHEVGHLNLGHIALQSEILMLGDEAGAHAVSSAHEYEADEFAIAAVKPAYRGHVVLHARILFEMVADLESLGFRFAVSHPRTTDRIERLLQRFGSGFDAPIRGLLSEFLANRRSLAERSVRTPPRHGFEPIGGGATRPVTFGSGDRVIDLPAKDICHDALMALATAYRQR